MLHSSKTYNVKKADLLAAIKTNRTKHVSEFTEATAEYRKRVEAALEKKLARVREGKKFDLTSWPGIVVPRNYIKEYDKVLGLLEMTTDDVIEITAMDYTQYVQDEWAWKAEFRAAMSSYKMNLGDDEDEIGESA